MEKQLYKVTFSGEAMVIATSPQEARKEAKRGARGMSLSEAGIETGEAEIVTSVSDVPSEWRDSIPFGKIEVKDETCQGFLGRHARYAAWLEGGAE